MTDIKKSMKKSIAMSRMYRILYTYPPLNLERLEALKDTFITETDDMFIYIDKPTPNDLGHYDYDFASKLINIIYPKVNADEFHTFITKIVMMGLRSDDKDFYNNLYTFFTPDLKFIFRRNYTSEQLKLSYIDIMAIHLERQPTQKEEKIIDETMNELLSFLINTIDTIDDRLSFVLP